MEHFEKKIAKIYNLTSVLREYSSNHLEIEQLMSMNALIAVIYGEVDSLYAEIIEANFIRSQEGFSP